MRRLGAVLRRVGGAARRWGAEALVVALLAVYVGLFAWDQAAVFGTPGWMGNDTRQNVMPAYRYHDSGLFEDDLPTDYMEAFQPVGYRALMWLATLALDPIVFSNWLSLALALAFVVFVVLAGRHVLAAPEAAPGEGGRAAGGLFLGAVAALVLLHDTEIPRWISGGLPRSFAYPLTAAFLWAWLSGRTAVVAGTLVAAAAVYPTVFTYTAPAYALSLVRLAPPGEARSRWPGPLGRLRLDGRRALVFAGAVAAALVLSWPQLRPADPRIGPVVTLEEARTMPEIGARGFVQELPFRDPGAQVVDQVGGLFAPQGTPIWKAGYDWAARHKPILFLGLVAVLLLTAAWWGPPMGRPVFLLAGAAVAVYAAARLLAFRLYVPERILRYSLPVVAALLIPAALTVLVQRLGAPRRWSALATAVALAAGLLLVLGDGRKPHNAIQDWSNSHPRLMAWLRAETPKDALVAGHPHLMNNVPCLAQRRVYYNYEVSMPYHKEYNREMHRRARRTFDALYATDWAALRALRDEEGVDLFIVEGRYLGPELRRHDTWFHMTKYVEGRAARLRPGSSPLLHPPEAAVLLRDGDTTVLDLHKL